MCNLGQALNAPLYRYHLDVPPEWEDMGLDKADHGEKAYVDLPNTCKGYCMPESVRQPSNDTP
jgi:hypothetical protein